MSRKRERRKREQHRRVRRVAASGRSHADGATAARKLLESAHAQSKRVASEFMQRDRSAAGVAALADGTRALALKVIQQSPVAGGHACQPGCAFCCHTAVTVAPPEALVVAEYLQEHCSADELEIVRRRLEENAARASDMTRDEYVAERIPCGLLTEDGNCRVHPVRPLCCAGFCSTSREGCEAAFYGTAGDRPPPTDDHAMTAGLGVSHGLADACRDTDRDGNFYELHHALLRVFGEPGASEKWVRGEDVFAGCLH